jgi:flavin reductase (DIM6/NTAB) family NADH-FMN oxidoreductase RutF
MIAWQIDVHHGDGVEEAFCYSSSVLTISFHHFAPVFFPGSGALTDQAGAGAKECIINVPLLEGCLARFECRHRSAHEEGDHVILVAQVERCHSADGLQPLLYHRGRLLASAEL